MQILLTGGSGFLGNHMASYLQNKGVHTICIGRNPCSAIGVENIYVPSLSLVHMEEVLRKHQTSFDAIIHLAAAGVHPSDRDGATLHEINAKLPGDIVKLGHLFGVKAIVMTGSSAEYQAPSELHACVETDPLQSEKLYGASKSQGGLEALNLGVELGVPVAWMRLFNVYGPGEAPHRLFPSLVTQLYKKEVVEMSEGNQVRDFVYVDDVCDALFTSLNALISGMKSSAYNVCTGAGHSVKDFALAVARTMKADESLLRFGALPLRSDELLYLVGDPSKFKSASGWVAAWSFENGISHAVGDSV